MTQSTATTLDEIRLSIYRQHTQLAQLLDELEEHASTVLAGGDDTVAMHDAVGLLHARFVRHLAYEEANLMPLLRGRPGAPGDPPSELFADHGDQRKRLDGLIHDRAVFGEVATVAREALALVHVLRSDMVEEDAKLRALR